MKKSNIPTMIRNALAVCEIPHDKIVIFNDKRKNHRRIKICGLPNMEDHHVAILENSLKIQMDVTSLQKHRNYNVNSIWHQYQKNSLVLITSM